MNAEKTKVRTAQLRADLSVCLQTSCDVIEHALGNAAKLRLSADEREYLQRSFDCLRFVDYRLNR